MSGTSLTPPRTGTSAPRARTGTSAPKDRRAARLRLISVLSVVAGLGLWWLLSALNPVTLPSPPDVVSRYAELIASGTLTDDIVASLTRVLIGFTIGAALAIPLGFVMGWYVSIRAVIEPWTQFFRMIPPLAIIPLAIVLLGIGEIPKNFVIALASFLVCIVATFQGVLSIDKTLINAGRVLGAGDWIIFRRIAVPASVPFIMVGLRQALGASWATLVAAELIAAQDGLGFRMQQAQFYYDLATIFVGLITIGILGLIMDQLLLWADTKLTYWQERR